MAIYFGNLDRELADRQNVLKEDAARQYRGSRDMMESFGDLGKTVERGMKDYSTAKLESAKLNYNIERNKESDQIRKLSFQQSTQRNKELSLDSQLKNIERFRVSSVSDHIGKQWYWRDPKSVRASYDERMKVFTADDVNIDAAKRMKLYPHLFGKEKLKKLEVYDNLLKLKANGVDVSDEQLASAKDALPVSPMNFMDWAKDGELFNENIKGNPGRAAGAMQTLALQNAGYNIPNVTELNERTQRENGVLQTGITEEKIQSDKTLAEKEKDLMGRNIIHKKKGAKVEAEETNETKNKRNPLLKSGEKPYKIINGQVWDKTFGQFRDSIEDVMLAQPYTSEASSKVELFGDEGRDHPGLSDNRGEPEHTDQDKLFIENIKGASTNIPDLYGAATNEANALSQYEGRQRYNQPDEVQVAVENGNPFTAVDKTLRSLGLYGRTDKAAKDMIEEGRIRDPAPELASMGGDLNNFASVLDYKNLPAYKETNSWVNLSKEEKTDLLQHPAIEVQGANPEKVFNFEKAREKLEDIDHEIVMLHNPLKKYSPLKDPGSSFSKLAVPVSKYGGKVGVNVELASLVEKYNATMPLLVEERKKLLTNFNKAERSMDTSKTRAGINQSPMYLGEATTDNQLKFGNAQGYGSASDYGISPATIRPKVAPIDVGNEMGRPSEYSTDLGYQAAVDANYAEDTQKEIIGGIIEREGWGPADGGYSYFDGGEPDVRGYYKEGGGETLTLAGGNNIWGTINGMPAKERKIEIEKVATNMFGNGGVRRKEFVRFMNMPEKNHKKEYDSIVKRGRLRLTKGQRDYLTDYSYRNHLNRLVKNHPYLSDIAQYPKEMQVFLMDNTFNMGPGWLKKFKKTEVHLQNWVKTRKSSDLEKMKEEYKNSDHYKDTTRAKDLLAMI